jgi:hypothetical protein
MRKIVFSIGNILDALNPLRNRGSLAHANDQLVERDEALLVVNLTRSIIQYLDGRTQREIARDDGQQGVDPAAFSPP